TVDPDGTNNSDTELTAVQTRADLSIVKTNTEDHTTELQTRSHTLSSDNAETTDAAAVTVSDTLPTGTSFVSASDGGTYVLATNTVTWNLGTFTESQAAKSLTLLVKVASSRTPHPIPTRRSSDLTVDPDGTNNSDTELTAVQTRADLSIVKT